MLARTLVAHTRHDAMPHKKNESRTGSLHKEYKYGCECGYGEGAYVYVYK